jgi:hypothetical protein
MKNISFIFVLLIGCSSQLKDTRIITFETYFGEDYVEIINEASVLMDSSVIDLYKSSNINYCYTKFLEDIVKNNIEPSVLLKQKEIKILQKKAAKIGLYNEIHLNPKKSYFENDELISVFEYQSKDSIIFEYVTKESFIHDVNNNSINIDSLIEKNKNIAIYNPYGKYTKALNLIKDNDKIITNYLDIKMTAGEIPISIIADGFLNSKADFKDYFVKRIFIIELFF